jgi:hypothetical protein
MKSGQPTSDQLSLPPAAALPRQPTAAELRALKEIADVLIPACADDPAATSEPGFDEALTTALTARADAFDQIVTFLHHIDGKDTGEVAESLRVLHRDHQSDFQPVSAVVAGAWLQLPTVRRRIGYPGQHRNPPTISQAVDELSDGILEPVLERGPIYIDPPGP